MLRLKIFKKLNVLKLINLFQLFFRSIFSFIKNKKEKNVLFEKVNQILVCTLLFNICDLLRLLW